MTDTQVHQLTMGEEIIRFSDRGRGVPLLLIHAGVFAAWFRPLADEPALAGVRLIEPVRAGYDPSLPAPTRHLRIVDHAWHCAAVLDTLEVSDVHVLAHSSGALIALQLAADRPDLVRSLALYEPAAAASLLPAGMAAGMEAVIEPLREAAASGDLGTAFDTFMRMVCAADYREVMSAALGGPELERAERDCGFFFRDETRAVGEWILEQPAAARITQAVLLVHAAGGPPMVTAIVTRLAAQLAHARTLPVAGADHLLPLRDPATLATIAADFIRQPTALTTHPFRKRSEASPGRFNLSLRSNNDYPPHHVGPRKPHHGCRLGQASIRAHGVR